MRKGRGRRWRRVLGGCAVLGALSASGAPAPASSAPKPGALISAEPVAIPLPGGVRGWKVLYQSLSVDGRPVPVSGLVFAPAGKAPKGGWPVLSFAHGTTGLADICAPSANLSAGATELALIPLLTSRGWLVAATDYEGLGTPGLHPYIVGVSEGRGVLDIARAARRLKELGPTQVSRKVAVWGHSQGGHAALWAGELARTYAPELTLLGVVAGAPPSQLGIGLGASLETSPFRGYILMVVAGLQAADPTLDLDLVLTAKGRDLLAVVDRECTRGIFREVNAVPFADVFRPDGLNEGSPWSAALRASEPGTKRISAPVLIVHGDKDEQIPINSSALLAERMCTLGTKVDRRVYAGQTHGGAVLASLLDVFAWLDDRKAARPAGATCGT